MSVTIKPPMVALGAAFGLVLLLGGCDEPPPPYSVLAQDHCRAVLGWMSRKAGKPSVVKMTNRVVNGGQMVGLAYELFEIKKPGQTSKTKGRRIFSGRMSCTYPAPPPGLKIKGMRALRTIAVTLNGRRLSDKQLHTLNIYVVLLGG